MMMDLDEVFNFGNGERDPRWENVFATSHRYYDHQVEDELQELSIELAVGSRKLDMRILLSSHDFPYIGPVLDIMVVKIDNALKKGPK